MGKLKSNATLVAALAYATAGMKVFPLLAVGRDGSCECGEGINCGKAGKHPVIEGWNKNASDDPDQLREWWGERPDRGIGIATGEMSGITVLDVDGDEGVIELGAIANEHGGMPVTPTSSSRPGRFHYYFAYNPDIKSRSKNFGEKLDTRGDNGYVVAPPSRHATGSVYSWITELSKAQFADWPEWLVEIDKRNKAKSKTRRSHPQRESFDPTNPRDVERLLSALPFIDAGDEEKWSQVGWIMGRAFRQSDVGFGYYRDWAGRSRKFDAKRTKGHYYERSKELRGGDVKTTGAIYKWARDGGWVNTFEIELHAGRLPHILDQCAEALATVGVYSRTGKLVHMRRVEDSAPSPEGIRRHPDQLIISPVSPEWARVRLGRLRDFIRYTKNGEAQRADFPTDSARALVGQGEWAAIKELRGIADAPTMRPDGSIVQAPGYDEASGLFLNLDGEWPPVPDRPTKAQSQRAMAVLLDPFVEVPFENAAARAAFASSILTAAIRPTLDTAPAIYVVGTVAGAGKTLLANSNATIVSGRSAPMRMLPTDDDAEMRKVITASLMSGDRSIVFDNIPRGHTVRSPSLDLALTSGTWTDRILGTNEQVTLPFRLNIFLTGNNITCHTDAVRRGVYIHINPQCEFPEQRAFRIPDLLAHLSEHRKELLVAALTVMRGYVVAKDKLKNVTPLGSFGEWSRRVREALIWIGMDDPVSTQARMRSVDEDRDELNSLLKQLELIKPDGSWFRAKDVHDHLKQDVALTEIVNAWGPVSARSIGKKLRSFVGQITNGRELIWRMAPADKIMEFNVKDGDQ